MLLWLVSVLTCRIRCQQTLPAIRFDSHRLRSVLFKRWRDRLPEKVRLHQAEDYDKRRMIRELRFDSIPTSEKF